MQTRQVRKPHGRLSLAAISAALILSACIPIPVPRLTPGISDEQLAPFEIGKTTRTEVEAVLGEPDIIWGTERIWVYEEGPSGTLFWLIPPHRQAGPFLTELGEDVVIMRFDEEGRVGRLDRRTGPFNRSNYGDFLRAWLAEQGDVTGSNENP